MDGYLVYQNNNRQKLIKNAEVVDGEFLCLPYQAQVYRITQCLGSDLLKIRIKTEPFWNCTLDKACHNTAESDGSI